MTQPTWRRLPRAVVCTEKNSGCTCTSDVHVRDARLPILPDDLTLFVRSLRLVLLSRDGAPLLAAYGTLAVTRDPLDGQVPANVSKFFGCKSLVVTRMRGTLI